jgi:hypothetical protein
MHRAFCMPAAAERKGTSAGMFASLGGDEES